jgi:hypothetical protein
MIMACGNADERFHVNHEDYYKLQGLDCVIKRRLYDFLIGANDYLLGELS